MVKVKHTTSREKVGTTPTVLGTKMNRKRDITVILSYVYRYVVSPIVVGLFVVVTYDKNLDSFFLTYVERNRKNYNKKLND